MAPEAPTIGMAESGSARTWAKRRCNAAQQIEREKARTRHRIFDVVAEEPEEPHVPDEMHPPAVEKHRREDVRSTDVPGSMTHRSPSPIWKPSPARSIPVSSPGIRPGLQTGVAERDVGAGALHHQPHRRHTTRSIAIVTMAVRWVSFSS